jgi:hypothetical protein
MDLKAHDNRLKKKKNFPPWIAKAQLEGDKPKRSSEGAYEMGLCLSGVVREKIRLPDLCRDDGYGYVGGFSRNFTYRPAQLSEVG